MRQHVMFSVLWLLLVSLSFPSSGLAQRAPRVTEREAARKFLDQLSSLFGRFRDSDLDRAFADAQPIQCAELVSDDGAWRPVAFFNENRRLGDWYHDSLDEVKSELAEYIFKGVCRGEQTGVQLTTKFPVRDSIDRYIAGRVPLKDIRVISNPPVAAYFEPRTQIYTFELPYLYFDRERSKGDDLLYSLQARSADDRYARDVVDHWECKSVKASDVTFQFLICQSWTLPRDPAIRRQTRPAYGSSAYWILSDGREATTSVKLSFGTGVGGDAEPTFSEPRSVDSVSPAADREAVGRDEPLSELDANTPSVWEPPHPLSKLVEVERREYRIRFSPQTWTTTIGVAQVLADQKMTTLAAARTAAGSDYCVWQPGTPSLLSRLLGQDPDREVAYSLKVNEADRLSSQSITFEMKTYNGTRLGTLQCFFPRAESAASVTFERWVSIVGAHLTIETQP